MASATTSSVVAFALLLFLCATTGHGRFRVLKMEDLDAATTTCATTSGADTDPYTMKVSHAYGPCSPLDSNLKVDLSELLVLDQLRVDHIHERMTNAIAHGAGDGVLENLRRVALHPGQSFSAVGVFVMTVGLGTPLRNQTVFFDTGSNLCWVQCVPCTDFCYVQKEPYFNPTISKTYKDVPCSSAYCQLPEFNRCNEAHKCVYGTFYPGGQASGGFLSQDTLSLTPTDVIPNFVFGCSENFQGFFGRAAGVFGLGRKPLSVINQAAEKYKNQFSYCLPYSGNATGYVKFGPAAKNKSVTPSFYTPMLTIPSDSTYYGISLTGIGVNGKRLDLNSTIFSEAGTILDSGTTVTYLPPTTYRVFRAAMRSGMKALGYGEPIKVKTLDTCYSLKGMSGGMRVPSVQLFFSGGQLKLWARNIVMPMNGSVVCLAFTGNKADTDMSIIGNTQQKGYEISLDLKRKRIGFASHVC